MPALTGVCLVSEDVPRLARFYSQLFDAAVEGDERFCVVHLAGAQLSLFDIRGMEAMAPGSVEGAGTGSMTLELLVDDVDAVFDSLTEHAVAVVKPPTTQPWGRRSAWIRDPDGNIVNLYCPVEQASAAEAAATYFRRLFDEHDLDACDDLLTPGYVDHDAPADTPVGPAATRAYVQQMLDHHRELRVRIQSATELGDHVALQMVWDGIRQDGTHHRETGLVLLQFDETGRIRERASTYQRSTDS